MDDRELLDWLQKDSDLGAEQLVRQYSSLVAAVVRGVMIPPGTEADLEECVSDTFLLFCRNLHRVDLGKGSVKAYLSAIARNAARSYRRTLHPESLPLMEEYPSSDDFWENREHSIDLTNALKKLPKQERELIWRRYYLGMSVKDIAAQEHITENAATLRIRRAIERLRKLLGKEEDK